MVFLRIVNLGKDLSKGKKKTITTIKQHVDVSENSGTQKSSILIGFAIINHPFLGTPSFGNAHVPVGPLSKWILPLKNLYLNF